MEWRLAIFDDDGVPVELHSAAAARSAVRSKRLRPDTQVVIYDPADNREMRYARDWPQLAPLFATAAQAPAVATTPSPPAGQTVAPAPGEAAPADVPARVVAGRKPRSDGAAPATGMAPRPVAHVPAPKTSGDRTRTKPSPPAPPTKMTDLWLALAAFAAAVLICSAGVWLWSSLKHKDTGETQAASASASADHSSSAASCPSSLPELARMRCKLPAFAMDDDSLSAAYSAAVKRGVQVDSLLKHASLDAWRDEQFSHCGQQYQGCLDWRYRKLTEALSEASPNGR